MPVVSIGCLRDQVCSQRHSNEKGSASLAIPTHGLIAFASILAIHARICGKSDMAIPLVCLGMIVHMVEKGLEPICNASIDLHISVAQLSKAASHGRERTMRHV
jgi:hypothetical protein